LGGKERKLLVTGKTMKLVEVTLKKGTREGFHTHDYEQVSYVAEGEIEIITDRERNVYRKGEGFCIPPNVKHQCVAVDDSIVVVVYGQIN